MKYLIFLLTIIHSTSYGQDELSLHIPIDSMTLLRTKEEIGRKTFKEISKTYRWKLDYSDFVNPGQEFNTTDIAAPPNSRLVLGIRHKRTLLILYEHGSYYGPLTQCIIAISKNDKLELFTLVSKVKTEDELLKLIQDGHLKVERAEKH